MTTRFATLLIDAADRLAEAQGAEAAWQGINHIVGRIGARSVNAGAFLRGAPGIAWMRSTMTEAWLAEYAEAGLFETDPLLRAAIAGRPPPLYDVAARETRAGADPALSPLHHGMMAHGYRYMITHSWFDGAAGKTLVLSTEDDPRDLFGPGTDRAFSAVSALLSLHLAPPGAANPDSAVFGARWYPLTPAERDVLSHLASGLDAPGTAEKLRIDLPELDRRIASAAAKMGAPGRDQTLALAMTRGLLSL